MQSVEGWCGGGDGAAMAVAMVRRWRALRGLSNAQDFSCMRSQEIFSGESRCSRSAFRLDPAMTKKGVERGPQTLGFFGVGNDPILSICPFLLTIFTVHITHKLHPGRSVRWHSGASKLMAASLTPQSATFLVKPR